MTQNELKQLLYELISEYFSGASITWSKVKSVIPGSPQVVLNMGVITRTYRPFRQNVKGVFVDSYPSKTTLQIDLYTKGAAVNTDLEIESAYENTAINDLTDFINYLNSAYVDDWCERYDVSILCNHVNDLTELINTVTWDYRAMTEIEIGFVQTAVGHTGIMWEKGKAYDEDGKALAEQPEFTQTPSGGRSKPLADEYTGWFNKVEGPEFIDEKDEE